MELYNAKTKSTCSDCEFYRLHPETSFPSILDSQTLADYGYVSVLPIPQPPATEYQTVERDGVALDVLGNVIQAWRVTDIVDPIVIARIDEAKLLRVRQARKLVRQTAVDAIRVMAGDKEFDGDETSQNRMSRAILGMQAANVINIKWTLANNVNTSVSIQELSTALILAGQRQAEIWAI